MSTQIGPFLMKWIQSSGEPPCLHVIYFQNAYGKQQREEKFVDLSIAQVKEILDADLEYVIPEFGTQSIKQM